jgi:GGDEF domain-containing protein
MSRVRPLRRAEHRLTHDPLTGLANRTALHQHFAGLKLSEPVVFALLNLDDFAAINEQVGYRGGDEPLVLLADGLRHRPRTATARRFGSAATSSRSSCPSRPAPPSRWRGSYSPSSPNRWN